MYTQFKAKQECYRILKKALGKTYPLSLDQLISPPKPEFGDLSFPVFALAKGLGRNPAEIATELAAKCGRGGLVASTKAIGPYLNFIYDNQTLTEQVLAEVRRQKARYGKQNTGAGKRVLIEYANLNTHKEVHLGHLRNLSYGLAMTNILATNGYQVIPVSYINDLGANVAKCLWSIQKFYPDFIPAPTERLNFLGRAYTEASQLLKADPTLQPEVSAIQKALEDGTGPWWELWKTTWQWSVDNLQEVFADFGLTLDKVYFEHELIASAQTIVSRMLTEGIAVKSEGAVIVDLTAESAGINLLRKTDNTLLYNAKDLALAYQKQEDYHPDRSFYVVDNRQSLALTQLFLTLRHLGFNQDLVHLSYDFVTLPEGAMSSRLGTIVRWTDLETELLSDIKAKVAAHHPEWSPKKIVTTAKKLTLASIKFFMLRQTQAKPIVFDLSEATAYEGFSGPYVMYALVRISSILTKSTLAPESNPNLLVHPLEHSLIRIIAQFPDLVAASALKADPSLLAHFAFTLAQQFGRYYEEVPIIGDSNPTLEGARLDLLRAIHITLTNALQCLGIETIKQM